jgi:16S rRNA (guanine527-N7)-methyltransferase
MPDTAKRLRHRAETHGIAIPSQSEGRLVAYFDLLFRWNRKINLTSLTDPDAAIDRLLLEPLSAATQLPHRAKLIDLGSGGGSPAIPLALALEAELLVVVESKTRKSAFLREAVRLTELNGIVEAVRLEDLAADGKYRGQMSIVSIRALRIDAPALLVARSFLQQPDGRLALFTTADAAPLISRLIRQNTSVSLIGSARLLLGT